MEKTYGILLDFCREIHALMGDSFRKMIVYGSYARGDYREDSDIDIMILSTLAESEIKKMENIIYDIAFDYEMEYQIELSVIIKMKNNFPIGLAHYLFMIM